MADLGFAHLPTPLERADRLGAALELPPGRLWVKRDDCTGLATGGNKVRKLRLFVADARPTRIVRESLTAVQVGPLVLD